MFPVIPLFMTEEEKHPAMHRIFIKVPIQDKDKTEELLFSLGASSVSAQEESHEILLCAITEEPDRITPVLGDRVAGLEPVGEDWKYNWIKELRPAVLSPNLLVVPAGTDADLSGADEGRRRIVLDPRDAFGDGHHPTTVLCMELIEEYMAGMDGEGKIKLRVLDMGTGTGILAIGASLLGAGYVDAVDLDPEAVDRASHNSILNGSPVSLHVHNGDAGSWVSTDSYNVITANLLSSILEGCMDHLASLASPGAAFIVSGVSSRWNRRMSKFFPRHGFNIRCNRERDGWHAYLLYRNSR